MRNLPPVIAWDIDGTLVKSWGLYDDIFFRTSSRVFSQSFWLTKNPYGQFDEGFMKLTGPEVFKKRFKEVFNSEPTQQDQDKFLKAFDEEVCQYAGGMTTAVSVSFLPNLKNFLDGLGSAYHVLVSSSTRQFQGRVLSPIYSYFDWENSYFVRETKDKTQALENIGKQFACKASCLVYFGDAPADMQAIKSAQLPPMISRLAVGVCFNTKYVKPEELTQAGADLVIRDYSVKTLKEFLTHLSLRPVYQR